MIERSLSPGRDDDLEGMIEVRDRDGLDFKLDHQVVCITASNGDPYYFILLHTREDVESFINLLREKADEAFQ